MDEWSTWAWIELDLLEPEPAIHRSYEEGEED